MRGLVNIRCIADHSLWCNLVLGISKLNPPMVLCSEFLVVVLNIVVVLVPPTSAPIKYRHVLVGKYNSVLIVV